MPHDRPPAGWPLARPGGRRLAAVIVLLALASALVLAACRALPAPVLVPGATGTPAPASPCPGCTPVMPVSALTQENIDANARHAQASATADIEKAQALASANAGTATQAAAIVEQDIGSIALQAQAAATASVLRAAALATFNAASSTQSSALTQSADAQAQVQLRLRVAALAATQSAAATGTQQWMGGLVAGTATTLADAMSAQTQVADASAQQAADQRQAQNQGPLNFVWKWGLPAFILVAAALGLWGFGRWVRLRTSRSRGPLRVGESRMGAGRKLNTNSSKPPRPD